MKRTKPLDTLLAHESAEIGMDYQDTMDDQAWEADVEPELGGDGITHEHARELILAQTYQLLPAGEANALADHLLVCDPCYRYAQDVAAKERKRNSGELK